MSIGLYAMDAAYAGVNPAAFGEVTNWTSSRRRTASFLAVAAQQGHRPAASASRQCEREIARATGVCTSCLAGYHAEILQKPGRPLPCPLPTYLHTA